jgi:hypothetical protein
VTLQLQCRAHPMQVPTVCVHSSDTSGQVSCVENMLHALLHKVTSDTVRRALKGSLMGSYAGQSRTKCSRSSSKLEPHLAVSTVCQAACTPSAEHRVRPRPCRLAPCSHGVPQSVPPQTLQNPPRQAQVQETRCVRPIMQCARRKELHSCDMHNGDVCPVTSLPRVCCRWLQLPPSQLLGMPYEPCLALEGRPARPCQ